MKIVFISNYFNHHQEALSEKLYQYTSGNFTFIETIPISEERKKLGWRIENYPSYVLQIYDIEKIKELKSFKEVDVVIIGSASEKIVQYCLKMNKTVIRYTERPLKNGVEIHKYIPRLLKWNIQNPRRKKIYLLCAGAFTANDYRKFGLFWDRAYKWGYFPETRIYNDVNEIFDKKKRTHILWCGRFLKWKHVVDVLEVAKRLKENNYCFDLTLIGNGEEYAYIHDMIISNKLENEVHLLDAITPSEVRNYMERSGIYLFTSDRKEGWGAVLNESMNSGCAVVASHLIGAVPYLIKDNENGLIYESGNIDMLYKKVAYLLDNIDEQVRLGTNAYFTIVNEWNADVAARRLIELITCILDGNDNPNLYKNGPCSIALKCSERWIER